MHSGRSQCRSTIDREHGFPDAVCVRMDGAPRLPEPVRCLQVCRARKFTAKDAKRRRSSGEIVEERTAEDLEREAQLRSELARNPMRPTMEANAKYGWFGRRSVHSQVSLRTINYELRCLFMFFRWCIRQNHLFANPVANVEKFRIPKRSLPRFRTSDELRKFFGACNEDERRLFSTIPLTGMRKGEVEHLTWQDANFELGIIFIQAKPEIGWQPKTDERIVPISPTLHQLLLEQYARRRSKQWVFANQKGQPDGHILEKLKKICRRAGIKAVNRPRPQAQLWRAPSDGRRVPRRHRGPTGTQGSGDDPDLCQGPAGAPADGGWKADGARPGSGNHGASLKRVTHADPDAETSLNLLEAGLGG